jgi:serine O-acetyltransferase
MRPGRSRLWECLRADVARLREEDGSLRALVRGLCTPGFQALLAYRLFRWCHERGIPTQPLRFLAERAVEILTGISLPAAARIGKGLRIHHFGGIILHPDTEVGERCTLYQGVTLGDRGGGGGAPRVGNDVLIGAGAKVLGAVRLGDGCRVGANAVVLTSVPAGYLAVGVPARLRPPRGPGQRHGAPAEPARMGGERWSDQG